MFIVLLNYRKPLQEVDLHLQAHRQFLEEGYRKGYFIASGPQIPRTGGVILSCLSSKEELETLLKQDPFYCHNIASYSIIEFQIVKWHPTFNACLNIQSTSMK